MIGHAVKHKKRRVVPYANGVMQAAESAIGRKQPDEVAELLFGAAEEKRARKAEKRQADAARREKHERPR